MTTFRLSIPLAALLATTSVQAEWSANLGWSSEYHYRGSFQKSSSASAGIDYGSDGFYAGAWTADVGDGQEVDGYFGYGANLAGFDWSLGYTGYFYTGDFDDTYHEVNIGGGYGMLSLDVAIGRYDNFDAAALDYVFTFLSFENNGFYARLGTFSRDFDGDYLEVGYGTSLAELDLGLSLIVTNGDLTGNADESLILTVGKTFSQ